MDRAADSSIDERLTAFLDGELDASARAALEAELAADGSLRARLETLRSGRPPREPFDRVLAMAPVDRLEAMLDAARPSWHRRPGAFAALQAIAAAVVLMVGVGIGFLIGNVEENHDDDPDYWREVVAEYVALYTPDTFAFAPSDREAFVPRLAIVGDRLGLDLEPEMVELPGLDIRGALLFKYGDEPLGQISYLSTEYGPVAVCIIRNDGADAAPAFEQRQGLNIVHWSHDGLGYLIIGHVPRDTLKALASTLSGRVS